jgi:hypothetical protein
MGISRDSSLASVLSPMGGLISMLAPPASATIGSGGSRGTDDLTSMVVAGTALDTATSDSLSSSGAGASAASSSYTKLEQRMAYTLENNNAICSL